MGCDRKELRVLFISGDIRGKRGTIYHRDGHFRGFPQSYFCSVVYVVYFFINFQYYSTSSDFHFSLRSDMQVSVFAFIQLTSKHQSIYDISPMCDASNFQTAHICTRIHRYTQTYIDIHTNTHAHRRPHMHTPKHIKRRLCVLIWTVLGKFIRFFALENVSFTQLLYYCMIT